MWTRLPQGFFGSPTVFSRILVKVLQDGVFEKKLSILIQYADDLLIASTSKESCIADTQTFLFASNRCAIPRSQYRCRYV